MAIIDTKPTSRVNLLESLYQVTSKKDILSQFDSKLLSAGKSKSAKYIHLLEQIVYYSHAIVYGQSVQTAHNYRQSFIETAIKNKTFSLDDDKIKEAFSFLNRTSRKQIEKTPVSKSHKSVDKSIIQSTLDLISSVKDELDNKTYTLSRGRTIENAESTIMIALVALSTGAKYSDILESLTVVAKRKGKVIFDNGITAQDGVILGLDAKTIKGYLSSIRKTYKGKDIVNLGITIRKALKKQASSENKSITELNYMYKQSILSLDSK